MAMQLILQNAQMIHTIMIVVQIHMHVELMIGYLIVQDNGY